MNNAKTFSCPCACPCPKIHLFNSKTRLWFIDSFGVHVNEDGPIISLDRARARARTRARKALCFLFVLRVIHDKEVQGSCLGSGVGFFDDLADIGLVEAFESFAPLQVF